MAHLAIRLIPEVGNSVECMYVMFCKYKQLQDGGHHMEHKFLNSIQRANIMLPRSMLQVPSKNRTSIFYFIENTLPIQLSAEIAPVPIVVVPLGHPLQELPSGEYVPANNDDLTNYFIRMWSQSGCINRKLLELSGWAYQKDCINMQRTFLSVSILLAINDIIMENQCHLPALSPG